MTAYSRQRTGFPAPAAGVMAWCMAQTAGHRWSSLCPSILGPVPASIQCQLLMWTMLILFCHRHQPQLTLGMLCQGGGTDTQLSFIGLIRCHSFFCFIPPDQSSSFIGFTMSKLNSLKNPQQCTAFNSDYFNLNLFLKISIMLHIISMFK